MIDVTTNPILNMLPLGHQWRLPCRQCRDEPLPGFPAHSHRGFRTAAILRKGLIEHSDSLGATARFGQGDVQWLTAGKGIVYAETLSRLSTTEATPLELC